MARIRTVKQRSFVMTGPEYARMTSRTFVQNLRNRQQGELILPTLTTLAKMMVNEDRVIVDQTIYEEVPGG